MKTSIVAALVAAAVLAGNPASASDLAPLHRPCQTEDSQAMGAVCYWHAGKRGNGQGTSFVVRSGVVTYITKERADILDRLYYTWKAGR